MGMKGKFLMNRLKWRVYCLNSSKKLVASKDLLLDELLDVFCDYVEVAFFWRRLLKIAAQFPKVLAPHLFELCIAKPIQMGNDVLYELCAFLETAAAEFTPEQRLPD